MPNSRKRSREQRKRQSKPRRELLRKARNAIRNQQERLSRMAEIPIAKGIKVVEVEE